MKNGHLYVTAPALEPALPVAFDTSRLKTTLDRCRFVPSMNTQNTLLQSISHQLEIDALEPHRKAFVIDHGPLGGARDTVQEFARKWLLSQRGYDISPNTPIEVTFRGE